MGEEARAAIPERRRVVEGDRGVAIERHDEDRQRRLPQRQRGVYLDPEPAQARHAVQRAAASRGPETMPWCAARGE